ncbi:ESPR-type extended signal peptide-containing protein [Burkholderia ubonensis]
MDWIINGIYKAVWNRALGAFFATSEIDSVHGKGKVSAEGAV